MLWSSLLSQSEAASGGLAGSTKSRPSAGKNSVLKSYERALLRFFRTRVHLSRCHGQLEKHVSMIDRSSNSLQGVGISEITRRNIVDELRVRCVSWNGRLNEPEFLGRLFDLSRIPSTDGRFRDADGDIRQHRINNYDWEDDWVFSDSRFNILKGPDEIFLRFICEMLHPVVRSDGTEVETLRKMINGHLQADGFHVVEKDRISGRPIFVGRRCGALSTPGVSTARRVLSLGDYVTQQIDRMDRSVQSDPALAIGTSKELVETCCKTILKERNEMVSDSLDLPKLVKRTINVLELAPQDIPERAKAAKTIKRLLSNLATITQGIAELRNHYGTGHGKEATTKGLSSRHAKLAVGAASTLGVFLLETHQARPAD